MAAAASLGMRAFGGAAALLAILALSLFLSAGSFAYWRAWVYLLTFGAATTAITLYVLNHDPALMERRLRAGPTAETERGQQIVQSIASVGFIAIFVVAGLGQRRGWSPVPSGLSVVGDVLVLVGFWVVYLTFRANSFTSATIEIGANQRVVDTGPYAVVRHPMYAGAGVLLLGSGLALGTWWSILPALVLMAAIVWRLVDEERFLSANLPGYDAYRLQTRYRLVPGIW